jgi:hypothetical protein
MIQILVYIGYVILLINLLLFCKRLSNKAAPYKIYTIYLGIIFVIQIIGSILTSLKINNLFLSHFYFIGQFIILSFFYLSLLKGTYQKKVIKIGLFLVLSILIIQYSIAPNLFFKFNLFEIFLTSFLIIIYATLHFYNMLNDRKAFYYINIGILMYLSGSTILFFVGNLMTSISPQYNKIPWILNAFFYIIYQLFVLFEWKKSFSKEEVNVIL